THNFERDLERRRCARRINHQVGAKSVPNPAHGFPHVHILNVHGLCGAKHSCHPEPRRIPRRSGDKQRSCAGLPGHLGAKETDRAGAYYNYSVPRSNLALHGRGGLRNDAVSLTKSFYPPPHSRNCAAKLMAEHDRHAHWPALRVVILMDVASADSDGAHTQQHLLFVDFRYGHLPQLDGKRREGVVHQAGHHLRHSRILRVISLNTVFKSPAAVRKECASTASGAPITTSGAPRLGICTASSRVSPPTACTGIPTAFTTASRSASGLSRPRPAVANPLRSS